MERYSQQYPNCKKAFTFIEVLASLVILSVALIPILTWLPTAIQTKLKAERKTTAIFLAQGKMEELRYRIINDFNYKDNGGFFNSPHQDFNYAVTYNSAGSNLITISVKVWHAETPQNETVFYTQIARR